MTPTDRDQRADVAGALGQARRQAALAAAALGAAACLAVGLAAALGACLVDNAVRLPAGLRLPVGAGILAALAWAAWRHLLQPLRAWRSPERTALMLERRFGVPDNLLINACQFERARLRPEEQIFSGRAIGMSLDRLAVLPLHELWEARRLRTWAAGAAIGAVLWSAYGLAFPRLAANACLRLAAPLSDIPPAGSADLILTPHADVRIDEGATLSVRLEVAGREKAGAPPVIVWREGERRLEPDRTGESAPMLPASAPGSYVFAFAGAHRSFVFRVFAAGTYTRSVRVEVRPAPRLEGSGFTVTPPSYTGLEPVRLPGPPAPLAALAGSDVALAATIRPRASRVAWIVGPESIALAAGPGDAWSGHVQLGGQAAYRIEAAAPASTAAVLLAESTVIVQPDSPPAIDFVTADRNRFVNPGGEIALDLQASDDYGIRSIALTARRADRNGDAPVETLKSWSYMGPPGNRGPVRETAVFVADPARFEPGSAYVLQAECRDFSPAGSPGSSGPLLVRIRSLDAAAATDTNRPLASAMALLRQTIAAQEKANGIAENLRLNLPDIASAEALKAQQAAAAAAQQAAQSAGRQAAAAFRQAGDGTPEAARLEPIVEGEMGWVLADIARLTNAPASRAALLDGARARQDRILADLIGLLGRAADRAAAEKAAPAPAEDLTPPMAAAEAGRELKDDLDRFEEAQRKIVEKSRTLLDRGPEDLTGEEEAILGELAREEAKWAAFFEEKLTDFSKLPLQDFADGSLAGEFNEVFMEVKLAAKSLYEKKIELAVPHEQSGLENAEELVQNLERWLPDTPDHLKWLMEEPLAPADVAMAELPSELEDIVGALLDKEEEMAEDVEDVTSSWMDSPDKGAGWDAMDGPISSMAAKGVTGNQLPNQQEIGGRSGEGRTGRSHGQMVEETAQGKGGRETPSRLTPSPFEQGSVEDTSKESPGGATGGGKLSGFAGEGLRGPVPPPLAQKMARLAGQQAAIRQEAEVLATKLRAYRVPGGDLETAVVNMAALEEAARRGYGPGVRQSFNRALDSLREARETASATTGLRREENRMPARLREEVRAGIEDGIPPGYEEMAGAYFRRLAGHEP